MKYTHLAQIIGTVGAAVILCPTTAYSTETYRVDVHFVCQPPAAGQNGHPCGYPSEAELRQEVSRSVAIMNRVWKVQGISYAPSVFIHYDAEFAGWTGLNDARKPEELEDAYVANNFEIHWIMTESMQWPAFSWSDRKALFTPITRTHADGGVYAGNNAAHEIGHYFCLAHPFSGDDGANPNFDGDGLEDTPPDPGTCEAHDVPDDEDMNNPQALVLGRTFCTLGDVVPVFAPDGKTVLKYDLAPNAFANADKGSPVSQYPWDPRCYENPNGTVARSAAAPLWSNVMSYYNVPGPWIVGGVIHNAFTPMQIQKVVDCKAEGHSRNSLVDICDGSGGDKDSDGICDNVDTCIASPMGQDPANQQDADGDGIVAECDPCDSDPTQNLVDYDGDGLAGLCDPDQDGDGCPDQSDKDPTSPYMNTGWVVSDCDKGGARKEWAGSDLDGDGLLSCNKAEHDSDGDGVPDDIDTCPADPNSFNNQLSCTEFESCGRAPDLKHTCFGPSCSLIHLVLTVLDRPYPSPELVALSKNVLYLRPDKAETASQLAKRLTDQLANAPLNLSIVGQSGVTLGVWSLSTNNREALLEMGAANNRGSLVALALPKNIGEAPTIYLTYAPGGDTNKLIDDDHDGVPNSFDNCVYVNNPGQNDTDNDHFGDACDPDFDNNGRVDFYEVLRVQACVGHHTRHIYAVDSGPSRAEAQENAFCDVADLDSDGVVSLHQDFLLRAMPLILWKPGPSGLVNTIGCGHHNR